MSQGGEKGLEPARPFFSYVLDMYPCITHAIRMNKLPESKKKVKQINVRTRKDELADWKKAAEELDVTLGVFIRTWVNYGCERNIRGKLIRT